MPKHVHTYQCVFDGQGEPLRFQCGNPVGEEAKELLEAVNDGDEEKIASIAAVIENRMQQGINHAAALDA